LLLDSPGLENKKEDIGYNPTPSVLKKLY